jgi:hypothetical protein
MRAGPGTHHELAVQARQRHFEGRDLAAEHRGLRCLAQRLFDQFGRQPQPVGVRPDRGTRLDQRRLGRGVDHRHAVFGQKFQRLAAQLEDLALGQDPGPGPPGTLRQDKGIRRLRSFALDPASTPLRFHLAHVILHSQKTRKMAHTV